MGDLAESIRTGVTQAAAATVGVRVLYLFGSQVTGNVWAESDLDVGVRWDRSLGDDARAKATLVLIRELTDRLGQLGERADVVDLDRVSSAVAFRAIRDGVRIHAASRKEANQLVVDVMRRYDDDAPRRELYRRAATNAVERMTEEQKMSHRDAPPEGLPDDPFAGERFIRVVGKRKRPPIGEPPTREARRIMDALPRRGVRAPKGVFLYRSHEEANRDWDAWLARSMAAER